MKFKLFCLSILFLISAGTICSADNTHMEVEPANFVTLEWHCDATQLGSCRFMRSSPDGSNQGGFIIPDRSVFVVTEFEWKYKLGPFPLIGFETDLLFFELQRVGGPGQINSPATSNESTKNLNCGENLFCAVAVGGEQMTTGFVVAQGAHLSPLVESLATGLPLSRDSEFLQVRIRGYLVAPSCGSLVFIRAL